MRRTAGQSSRCTLRPVMGPIASDPAATGLFLDFDGTLAPIVLTPEEARPLEGTTELLDHLASRYAIVAIISGRPAADVASRLPVGERVRILGLYGLEDRSGPRGQGIPMGDVLPEVQRAAALVPGARVEDKGLQVAVHYRGVADEAAAERILRERLGVIAGRRELVLLDGKKVLELAPAAAPDKGEAVRETVREAGVRAVVYAGDDVGDLPAFATLEELREEGLDTLAIAVRTDETPEELLVRADLVVEGPEGLAAALRDL